MESLKVILARMGSQCSGFRIGVVISGTNRLHVLTDTSPGSASSMTPGPALKTSVIVSRFHTLTNGVGEISVVGEGADFYFCPNKNF